jgi:hypothetical protein
MISIIDRKRQNAGVITKSPHFRSKGSTGDVRISVLAIFADEGVTALSRNILRCDA